MIQIPMYFFHNDDQQQKPPQRIVSLVPSQTELLFDLGLEKEVVGITKFCVHPAEWFRKKVKVGGTKNINFEQVKALQPDLIIANKEENVKEQVAALATLAPVWVTEVDTFADALTMIEKLGQLTFRSQNAKAIIAAIEKSFARMVQPVRELSVLYLIWRNPWMTIGRDTFIHNMLATAGLGNIYKDQLRYPEIAIEDAQQRAPDLIFLSSEPYPFGTRHLPELQQHFPNTPVILVDGESFSWYGSRLLHAAAYLNNLVKEHGW